MWQGRGILETPRIVEAHLAIPKNPPRLFGKLAVKDYKTAIKEEDAPTLLPPTVAQKKLIVGSGEDVGRKLAVQMWMDEPTAEEYILEVAKIKNVWKHLIKKRKKDVTITDLPPQNVKKWVIDADVYRRDTAKEWDKIAIREFLERYGEAGVSAITKAAKAIGLHQEDIKNLQQKLKESKIDDDVMSAVEKIWNRLPKTKYFWEHHVNKDLQILQGLNIKIPYRRRQTIKNAAENLRRSGHKNHPASLLNLLELERNIVAEWISAYKRELKRWKKSAK